MKQITIKSVDLVGIVIAAEFWYKKQNEITNSFALELKRTKEFKQQLYETDWEENAELRIEEDLPF